MASSGASAGGSSGSGGGVATTSGGQPTSGGTASGGQLTSGGTSAAVMGGMTAAGGALLAGAPGSGGFVAKGGSGGGTATGGSASAGATQTGGSPASGGSSGGSAGGSTGGSSAGGSSTAAAPSPGCGKSGRPNGGTVTVQNDHIYSFPTSYDGTKPLPLLIAFHACGNPIDQFLNLTKGSGFETDYVRAFPRSSDSGGCWTYSKDIPRVTKIYDDLLANYCFDTKRVFAVGHSSGAQMIVQILTHKSDAEHLNFKAVAPVAASDYGALALPQAVLHIQGKMDSVRGGDGAMTVARFVAANKCSSTTKPYSAVMGCQSSGKTVNPGCVSYDGCQVPTIACSHDDPNYSNTYHGVPCFGIKAMYDFFTAIQ